MRNTIIITISAGLAATAWSAFTCGAFAKGAGTLSPAVSSPITARVQQHVKDRSVRESDLQALAKILKQNPKDSKAHGLLGDCYSQLGMLDMADSEYLESIKYDSRRDELYMAAIEKVYAEKGILQAEQKLQIMQEALVGSPVTVLLRVTLMLARGNEWGANHVCEVWERTHTDHFSLATARALILYHAKRYKEALVEVEKDLRTRPQFTAGQTLKGRIVEALKAGKP
jgi:tetratricopeptide (TPR) repeat protein